MYLISSRASVLGVVVTAHQSRNGELQIRTSLLVITTCSVMVRTFIDRVGGRKGESKDCGLELHDLVVCVVVDCLLLLLLLLVELAFVRRCEATVEGIHRFPIGWAESFCRG